MGRSHLPEMLSQPAPVWSEIADFVPLVARSASAVTPMRRKFN